MDRHVRAIVSHRLPNAEELKAGCGDWLECCQAYIHRDSCVTTKPLEPCPKCLDSKALTKWKDAEVSCGRCGFNAPFDVWQSRACLSPASAASVVDESPQKTFPPPAEDKLHIAICNAVQSDQYTASDILRQALLDYQPTQLTRTELIRVQQRSGLDEVSAVMVSPAAATPAPQQDHAPNTCKRAFPCRYSDARQCARDTMLGSECPKVCECPCHPAAPVEQSSGLDEATMEWALRELADGWIQNNEREGPHGFNQNARRVLNAIVS